MTKSSAYRTKVPWRSVQVRWPLHKKPGPAHAGRCWPAAGKLRLPAEFPLRPGFFGPCPSSSTTGLLQPQPDQPQHRSIRNTAPEPSHQWVVGDAVKVAGQIRVVHFPPAFRVGLRSAPAPPRALRPGRNPCEQSRNSASKIGSMTSKTAI